MRGISSSKVKTITYEKKALFRYLCALLLFGLNGIIASHIAMNSYEIVFTRTMIGSVFLLSIFLFGKGKFHVIQNMKDTIFIALSGISMGTSWMFLYEAYQKIGVSLASLLYYCGPMIVIILSPFIFKEKLTKSKIAGSLIVLTGVLLVNSKVVSSGNAWGLFCGAMSAVMYFFMVTLNKQSKIIAGIENSVIQLMFSFLTVAVFVSIKQGFMIYIPNEAWLWILTLGIINTGIGCHLYFSSLSKLPVQTVAICGYLEPLSAVIFAALLLGDRMTVSQVIGATCIIGGAMIGEL